MLVVNTLIIIIAYIRKIVIVYIYISDNAFPMKIRSQENGVVCAELSQAKS